MDENLTGALHHVELWVPSIERAAVEWGWMLTNLGYELDQHWGKGASWRRGGTYIVAEESPAMSGTQHDRMAPGLNHLAFHAGTKDNVDAVLADALTHGWTQLFADKYPHAGGDDHYAAYLVNSDGFEVELVAAADPERA